MAKSRINLDKLVDYAHRMKMASIIRQLGFVLETLTHASGAAEA
jgi:predicted transcriptional regulator of viral defense system